MLVDDPTNTDIISSPIKRFPSKLV